MKFLRTLLEDSDHDIFDDLLDDLSVQSLMQDIAAARNAGHNWDSIASSKDELEDTAQTEVTDEEWNVLIRVLRQGGAAAKMVGLKEMHHEQEEAGEKCIRCRRGTMHKGDTMMGAAKKCDRCGYQQQVEEEEDTVECECGSKDVYKYDIEDDENPGRVGYECNKCGEGWEY